MDYCYFDADADAICAIYAPHTSWVYSFCARARVTGDTARVVCGFEFPVYMSFCVVDRILNYISDPEDVDGLRNFNVNIGI